MPRAILIHGVGGTRIGAMEEAVANVRGHAGGDGVEVSEFHWNSLIENPLGGRWKATTDYLTRLMRGVYNSAFIGDSGPGSFSLRGILVLLLSLTPLFLIWGVSLAGLHVAEALPRAWQPLLPTIFVLLVPAFVMGRLAFSHSQTLLEILSCTWMAAIFLTSLLYIVIRTATDRRHFASAVRTVVLSVTWQVIALTKAGLGIVRVIFVMLPLIALLILYNFSINPVTTRNGGTTEIPAFTDLLSNAPWALTSLIVLGLATVLAIWFVRKAINPALKVLADIFLYLGDPEYRSHLQDGLRQRLSDLYIAGDDLYLVAHSLGSVIALDALLPANTFLSRCRSITLITLGSPLRRLFWRYFRSSIASPDDLTTGLARQYKSFRWVNIYRPFDPIGTRLFRTSGRDFSTGQYGRLLAWAHVNYWSDPVAARCVRMALSGSRSMPHLSGEQSSERSSLFEGPRTHGLPAAVQSTLLALLCFLPVIVVCASRLYFETYYQRLEYAQHVRLIESNPRESDVLVSSPPHITTGIQGQIMTYEDHLITYSTDTLSISRRIDGDLADLLQTHARGPVKARYWVGDPHIYYIPNYDEPEWPSEWGVVLWGVLSWLWCRGVVDFGPSLVDRYLGHLDAA